MSGTGSAAPRGISRPLLRGAVLSMAVMLAWTDARAQAVPPSEVYGAAPATAATRRGLGSWVTETSVTAQTTFTNNANYGLSAERQGDLILELIPRISFNREGARLKVSGNIALDMLAFVKGTQVNSILPTGSILASLEAVENLFYIDGSVTFSQQVENAFLPTSLASTTNNLYTSTQVRLAPYMKGSVGPYVTWQVRSDNSYTWTSQTNNPTGNGYFVRNLAEVIRAPTPFGLTLRLTNDLTRQQGQVQQDQTLNTALAVLDYAFTPQFKAGLRGGYESTTYTATETSGPIYGANISWRPTPLTSAEGYWEERFYGPSYQYALSHRQRRVATSITGYRTISTYPQVLLQLPPTGNVTSLLNSALAGRFPDPVERAKQVQDLIQLQGLPQSLPSGAYIYNQGANIYTSANAGWALTGARNTLGLNLFYLKTEYLADARIPPSFQVFNNSIQTGAGATLTHQLSPVISLSGTLSTAYTKGFDQNAGLYTRQSGVVVQSNWQVSPRTTAFAGARYQAQYNTSTILSVTESSEAAVFAGLSHRL